MSNLDHRPPNYYQNASKNRRASAQSVISSWKIKFLYRLKQEFGHEFEQQFELKQEFGHEFEQQLELEFEFEQEFELELLLLLRSAHARRRLWEPSDTGIVVQFQAGCPLFLKQFSEWFFSQKWCQLEP